VILWKPSIVATARTTLTREMPAKKHHFVPVFYQRGFADAEGRLWRYDRKTHLYQHLYPKVICREENLYAVSPEGLPNDQRIETDVLAPIESRASVAIKKIASQQKLTDDELKEFCFFMGLQYSRLPSIRLLVRQSYEITLTSLARVLFADVARARMRLDEMRRDTGVDYTAEAENIVRGIREDEFRVEATERPFLEHMFQLAETVVQFAMLCEWQFLIAAQDTGFIISDHPFATVVPKQWTEEHGPYIPGAMSDATSYFPITRQICLRLRAGQFSTTYVPIDNRAVRTINLNICANSDRFVMGRHKAELEHIVRRSRCQHMDPNPRFRIEPVHEDEDDAWEKMTYVRRRNFY
jgi:hypothetical protein